jgi:ABC-2 type transport system permease protein
MRDRTAPIQLAVNAEKGSAAGVVQSYALTILSTYSSELGTTLQPTMANVRSASGDQPPTRGAARIEVPVRNRYNQTLNYKHYMVPGLLVALVTLIATLVSAQNIAREKELGTLEQLNVTPLTRGQFIAGKLLPFWVLGMVDLGVGLGVGWLVFDIPVRGSLVLLFGAAAIYRAGDRPVDFEPRGHAAAGDVRDVLRSEHLSVVEWSLHACRQHGAVGADRIAAQSRPPLRDDLTRRAGERSGRG